MNQQELEFKLCDECQSEKNCLPGELEDPYLLEVYGLEVDYEEYIAIYCK